MFDKKPVPLVQQVVKEQVNIFTIAKETANICCMYCIVSNMISIFPLIAERTMQV